MTAPDNRIVTAADDRGDGNEGADVVSKSSTDELAIAVERVKADLAFSDKVAEQHGGTSCRSMFSVADLRLILSRLASQEETIRADGEALKPFAEAADNMDGDEPDGLFIYDSPESTMISYADLRAARARLSARQDPQA